MSVLPILLTVPPDLQPGGRGGPGRHRVVYALLVINKAGGLIYQREFHAGLLRLSSNDYLVLAGTFHGYVNVHINVIHSIHIVVHIIYVVCVSLAVRYIYIYIADTPAPTTALILYRVHAITRSLTPRLPIGSGSGGSGSGGSGGSGGTESVRPVPGAPLSGLEVLETERFRMTCFQTVTGLKFLLFTDPTMTNVDGIMHKVYELYADYVMKNPFYQLDMPVRCEAFDRHLGGWLNTRGYATIS